MRILELFEKWDDSGASDADGRWAAYRDEKLSSKTMARWLLDSRVHKKVPADKLKSAYGAIAQQQNTSKLLSSRAANRLRDALASEYKSRYGET